MSRKGSNKKSSKQPPPPVPDNDPEDAESSGEDEDLDFDDGMGDGHPGGPRQSEGERRGIRRDIREMITDIRVNKHEYTQAGSNKLTDTLLKTNQIFDKVQHTREAAYDATLVAGLSDLGRQKAQSLNTDFRQFSPSEFATKLMSFLSTGSLNDESRRCIPDEGWQKLGRAVQPFFRRSPALHLLYGHFKPEEPTRKVGKKNIRKDDKDSNAGPVAPKQLKDFAEMQKQETTTAEVEKIGGILQAEYEDNGGYPICFFKFVVNPQSFGQTIENIFYASFLVRDGHARVMLDEDKLPVIEPVLEEEGEERNQNGQNHQVIMSITKLQYQDIVKTFNIQTPIIPTRDQVNPEMFNNNEVVTNGTRKGGKSKNSRR